ncbi:hypothetical protein ACFWIA_25720 [Streptomyces sp. NPDC127068]|uniref:hypothetical protein n=1 Tax=Streptomyces sp. NPDC127068 TaxID=3347127 RepID=UPI00364AFE50
MGKDLVDRGFEAAMAVHGTPREAHGSAMSARRLAGDSSLLVLMCRRPGDRTIHDAARRRANRQQLT